ncbi:hypothetical protein [Halobacteriaceae bacterium SHR40]|uniref:hypothetical protein n=1 Tax=Halovenus amylolytica TaxID=2500550 RepID=UPI000FE38ACC
MDRKNVTIREDQSEWVDDEDINLSQLVQEAIDDRMPPSEEELAKAYRENADHAAETNKEWEHASTEANEHLGEPPRGNE